MINDNKYIIKQRITLHDQYKEKLLKEISNQKQTWFNKNTGSNVTNTDWSNSYDMERPYVKTFIDIIVKGKHLRYTDKHNHINSKIHNVWYSQYYKNDIHNWHTHSECQFTNIYYLELGDTNQGTEIYDGFENKRYDYDLSEGDMLTMPSFLPHRSKPMVSDVRKTVIVFNSSFNILKPNQH